MLHSCHCAAVVFNSFISSRLISGRGLRVPDPPPAPTEFNILYRQPTIFTISISKLIVLSIEGKNLWESLLGFSCPAKQSRCYCRLVRRACRSHRLALRLVGHCMSAVIQKTIHRTIALGSALSLTVRHGLPQMALSHRLRPSLRLMRMLRPIRNLIRVRHTPRRIPSVLSLKHHHHPCKGPGRERLWHLRHH